LKIYNEAKIKKSLEIYKNAQKHYNKGDFCAARELYNEFLTENLKTDLVLNAKAYKKLASIAKKDNNKLSEVIENHLKALEINEKLHGFLHKSVRRSYLDLSEAYIKLQDYQNAFIYCEKSLNLLQAGIKKKGQDISKIYYYHGLVCMKLGDYEKACESHKKALEVRNNASEENFNEVVASHEALAEVYMAQGDNQKALENYEAGLEIKKNVDRGDAEWISTALEHIGDLNMKLGNLDQAISSLNEALKVKGRLNTNNHEYFAKIYTKLANCNLLAKNFKDAEYFIRMALKRKEIVVGDNHVSSLALYKNLGLVYRELGQHQKSYHYYNISLDLMKENYKEDFAGIADGYDDIGSQLTLLGKYTEAMEAHRQAEKIRIDNNINETYGEIKTFMLVGNVHMEMKENMKATECFLNAEGMIKLLGLEGYKSQLMELYEKLGKLAEIEKDFDNAIKYYNEAVKINQELFGVKDVRVKALWKKLGLIYVGLGSSSSSSMIKK